MATKKDTALLISTESSVGGNTKERIGGLFSLLIEDKVERVASIAELKVFEGAVDGDYVYVDSHTSGTGYGGGFFQWVRTPIATVQSNYGSGTNTISVSATTEGLAKDYDLYGEVIEFTGGVTGILQETDAFNGTRVFPRGSTSLRAVLSAAVTSGEEIFFPDDNGTVIKPTYVGFDGNGRWHRVLDHNEVTFEMFGAIPAFHIDDAGQIDNRNAIQSAFSCRYSINQGTGVYYVSDTVKINRSKAIKGAGLNAPNDGRQHLRLQGYTATEIWSDTSNDLVKKQVSFVEFIGIILNLSKATTHSLGAFTDDVSYRMWTGIIDIRVIGSEAAMNTSKNSGVRAYYVGMLNAAQDPAFPNATSDQWGYVARSQIKVDATYCHSVFNLNFSEKPAGGSQWANGFDVLVRGDYCKYGIISTAGSSRFWGTMQTRQNWTPEFKGDYVNTIGGVGTTFDVFTWDLASGQDWSGPGPFTPENATNFTGGSVEVGAGVAGLIELQRGKYGGIHNLSPQSNLRNPSGYVPSQRRTGTGFLISRLENRLWAFDKRGHSYTINQYKAPTEDYFDTTHTTSEALPTGGASLTNADKLFDFNSHGLEYSWDGIVSDPNLSFIEIVLNRNGGDQALRHSRLFVSLGRSIRDVQYIEITDGIVTRQRRSGPALLATGYPTVDVEFTGSSSNNPDTVILRLIGYYDASDTVYLREIATFISHSLYNYLPYIHIGGQQRIYGSLEVNTPILRSPDGSRWTIDNTGAIVPYS